MKLIVLDIVWAEFTTKFVGGNCHIFTVTKEMCESEDNIVDFLMEKDFNLDNIQYMYGDISIISDMSV